MPGISDYLDSDMEDAPNYIDENSIISSASEGARGVKATAAKKPRKRKPVTMPKKSRVIKSASPAEAKKTTKKITGEKRKALEMYADEHVDIPEGREPHAEVDDPRPNTGVVSSAKTAGRGKRAKDVLPHVDEEDVMQVEDAQTIAHPGNARGKPASKAARPTKASKASATKAESVARAVPSNNESEVDELENAVLQQDHTSNDRSTSRHRQEGVHRRRAGSASDTERGDPNLRRRLGDITRKFENVELRYRNLKEVGINEANTNMEKLRKQHEAATEASNKLIVSLRKQLELQAPLAEDGRKLRKDVKEQESEIERLQAGNKDIASSLTAAQNEIKTLQAKLSTARKASVEPAPAKTPGSAMKGNVPTRTVMVGNSEAAQIAQMKLDLYGDLTGLIIRSVKKAEDGDTYDCIQTGRNGTLHFKLFIDQEDAKNASFEDTEFLYTPLLDASRDREMIELMPQYLTEDITFARQNAAKFYQRVVDTLTRRSDAQ